MSASPRLAAAEVRWLAVCASLAVGEWCGFRCPAYAALWPAALVTAVMVALLGHGLAVRGWGFAAVAVAGAALAMGAASRRLAVLDEAHEWGAARPLRAVFTLDEDARVAPAPKGGDRVSFQGEIRGLKVRVLADVPAGTAPPRAGEVWEAVGWLAHWGAHGVADRRDLWVRGGGTYLRRVASAAAHGLAARLRRIRAGVAARLAIGGGGEEGSHDLARAMLLGERARLDGATRQAFVASGALHVFAISGLHVMAIDRALGLLCAAAFVPLRLRGLLTMPVLWLYVLMIGAPPSAVRAAAMASLCAAAPVFFCRPNGVVAWAATFLLAHILRPAWIVEAGSGLSFVVMLALVLLVRLGCGGTAAAGEPTLRARVADAAVFGAVAWAAGVPIAARVFGCLTPGGLVSGLFVVPMAAGVVTVEVLAVAVSFVSTAGAAHVNAAVALLVRVMASVADVVARLPGSMWQVPRWGLGECLAWYFALVALAWLVGRVIRRRRRTL